MLSRSLLKGDRDNQPRRFRLVWYFTLASLVMLIPAALILTYSLDLRGNLLLRHSLEERENLKEAQAGLFKQQDDAARRDLLAIHEAGNVNLARLFEHTLWGNHFAPFVASAQKIPVQTCRAMADVKDEKTGETKASPEKEACFSELGKTFMRIPGFVNLNAHVYAAMRQSTVFKIKVYDLRGITLYSSEHSQIGQDKASDPGWIQAKEGKSVSQLGYREKFSAFEGVVENRDLIGIYLPVLQPGSKQIVGVFEVYSDVTPLLEQIDKASADIKKASARSLALAEEASLSMMEEMEESGNQTLIIVLVLVFLLFGALFMIVRRAAGIITKQEDEGAQAVEALRKSESRFRTMFEGTADALLLLDPVEGQFIDCNQATVDMLRCTDKKEVLLLRPSQLSPLHQMDGRSSEEKANEMIATAQRDGSHRFEWIHCSSHREDFPVEVLLTPVLIGEQQLLITTWRDITEQKQASQNARNMASIIESSNEAIVSANLDDIITSWNAAAERMFGYLAEEIIGQPVSLLFPPENTHEFVENQSNLRKGYLIEPYETIQIRKDGSIISISLTISPTYNESGTIIGASGIARDLTEEKQASQNARNMASIIESSNDSITSASLEGTFTSWNPAAERMYGYLAEEIIGQSISLIIPPENTHELVDILSKMRDGYKIEPYETTRIKKDGSTFPISLTVSPIYDENGVVIGVSGMARDITERKQAQELLEKSRSLLRATLESTADGILVVDATGRISGYNEKFVTMWGLPADILAQGDDKDAIHFVLDQLKDPEGFLAKVNDLYNHPEEASLDLLEFKDGKFFERQSLPQRINGEPVGRVWSFSDITEHKEEQEEILRLNASLVVAAKAKDEFIEDMNHELRTPLTSIIGYMELIIGNVDSGVEPKLASWLTTVQRNSLQLQILVENLMQVSKADLDGALLLVSTVDFGRLLGDVVKSVGLAAGDCGVEVELRLDSPASDLLIDGDANQLERVFVNLVQNAIKFTPPEGKATIVARRAHTDGGYVEVTVSDTGIGIPLDEFPNVFKRFFRASTAKQTAIPGVGIGLSLVHSMVLKHHGTVTFDSTVGKGTVFTVRLPTRYISTREVAQTT